MRTPDRPMLGEAGLCGLLPAPDDPRIRLLVTSDQAHEALAGLLPEARAGMIRIFRSAARCARLVDDDLAWGPDTVTAMVCSDLSTVAAQPLPSGLVLRPVRRLPGDDQGGVALEHAIAAVTRAAPSADEVAEGLAASLRSLPSTFRLFVAVDGDGTVRATSGCGVFGQHATVLFVNTDPAWRGRGVGWAMTAQALDAARRSGARLAALDASAAALSLYSRLGFETAGTVTRFMSGP